MNALQVQRVRKPYGLRRYSLFSHQSDPMFATMPKLEQCPICGGGDSSPVLKYRGKWPIVACHTCGSHFCQTWFSSEALAQFYGKDYFQGAEGYQNYGALEAIKRRTFAHRLRQLEPYVPAGKRLLDVGCANGLLVQTALDLGWDAYGLDISAEAIAEARRTLGARVQAGTLEAVDWEPHSFDAIVMSDMLEHVHFPAPVIARASELLKPNGGLLIETPNLAGAMRWMMGTHWPMYRPPEHLIYFSPKSLREFLARQGFETLCQSPSWKALTLEYILEKLAVSNPFLTHLLRPLARWGGQHPFWIPAGSFWNISRPCAR